MSITNKVTLVVLVQVLQTVLGQQTPQWGESYTVQGVLHLPYAGIEETFEAWYDGKNNNSRTDFYDGVAKVYQLAEHGYGINLKVVPFTTEEVLNEITCFLVNGTEDNPVTIQSMLPAWDDFTYEEDEQIGEKLAQKWTYSFTEGEKTNNYTLYVQIEDDGSVYPIRYRMMGYNTLLSSHYDLYYIDYFYYDTKEISKDVFEFEFGQCRDFPGPGNKHSHIFNPMAEFIKPVKTEHVDSRFNEFIDNHGKQYKNGKEHTLRKEVFRQNLRYIESINRKNKRFTLAVNHLADKTEDELKILRGRLSSSGYNGGLPFPHTNIKDDDFPAEYDWRPLGAVTPVKDQAVCGSCWSFGTVGALEGAYFLKTGKLVRLSEQALVDCSWGYGNNGCDGGEDYRSYQWVLKHGGIPTYEDYGNYLGEDGYCYADNFKKIVTITGYVNVTTNKPNALKMAIFKHGPISVAIDASHRSFSFYSSGVYYEPNCLNKEEDLDHAVLAVGYGTLNGDDFWIVKNSWSTYWGDEGYILMSSKDNNCGVMTQPTYVIM